MGDVEALAEDERVELMDALYRLVLGTVGDYPPVFDLVERLLAAHVAAARAEERERWAGEVRALIETLPRNEFGDQYYLAVEAAYANVARRLPDTREDLRPREGA